MITTTKSQPALSDLKSHTGFWLRFVSNHVSQSFARRLLASGVTVAEWVILREMFGKSETSPSVLAEVIGLTRGAVSKLVDRLVTKELITRKESSEDRRFQRIALTPAGTRIIPKLASIADKNDELYFSVLSPKEREALCLTLKKLVHAHSLTKIPIK